MRIKGIDHGKGMNSSFAQWEAGNFYNPPAPPAVRLAEYRAHIIQIIQLWIPQTNIANYKLISLGCGMGVLELELKNLGVDVLATDISKDALEYSKAKGLQTLSLNVLNIPDNFPNFEVVYADGLLGYLWDTETRFLDFASSLHQLMQPNAIAILSNEISDDENICFKVTHDPLAQFFRGPKGFIAKDICSFIPELSVLNVSYFKYERPNRGIRIREILTLKLNKV